jgi:hypothetical protein
LVSFLPYISAMGDLAGESKTDANSEILLAMQQAQSEYKVLKQEHARLLAVASDTAGTADGALTLARMKKASIALHEALERYHAALQRFASVVLNRPRQG